MLLFFQKIFILGLLFLPKSVFGQTLPIDAQGVFYSETQYDSRFDGAVTDSRYRHYFHFFNKRLSPYAGFHFTRDLSNGGAPRAIQNAFQPALGLQAKILKKPWLIAFGEKRQIYRTESPSGQWQDDEFRYGLVFYFYERLQTNSFFEGYGEWVAIDRVDIERGALASWFKLGHSFQFSSSLSLDGYTEAFTRQSPLLDYGPTENEARLGVRLRTQFYGLHLQVISNYALYSNLKPGGWDALLVLSMEVY